MIFVFWLISVAIMILARIAGEKRNSSAIAGAAVITICCDMFAMIVLLVLTFELAYDVTSSWSIDDKIAMYQEENTKIEEEISALVENYMKYEADTLAEFKTGDSVTLVSMYPELKSDELVQHQISVFTTNNEKIKELKEEKLDAQTEKWWLYFGGK